MAKQFAMLEAQHRAFIKRQHIFFVASAAPGTRVNLSPRSTHHLRVLGPRSVAYLDLTGSGNETAAHARAGGRMTIMLCEFAGPPLILRLYGQGRVLGRGGAGYQSVLDAAFDGRAPVGARQIVRMDLDLVQTSCGFGVPLFEYRGERDGLLRWAEAKGPDGLEAYQREHNAYSIDGLPTGICDNSDD